MEALREKAEAELMRLHPDFGEIRDTVMISTIGLKNNLSG
jgi:hypothetical protein